MVSCTESRSGSVTRLTRPCAWHAKKAAATSSVRFSLIGDREVPQAPARDLTDLVEHLNGCVKIAADAATTARADHERVRHSAFSDYQSLVSHFQLQHNFAKFAKFEAQCLSEYGPDARQHLDLIAEQLPGAPRLAADEFPKRALRFEHAEPNNLFDSFMDGLNKVAESQQVFDDAVLASLDMKAQAGDIMRECCGLPKVAASSASDLLASGVGKVQSSAQRYLPAALGGTGPGAEGHDKAVGDAYGKAHTDHLEHMYKRPQQEADMEMDNIHRATILKDILANDEIVSALDPHMVQGAYNGLLRLAPEATLNRAMVAGYLRTAGSQQALDPFTAKQLGDVTKVQLENKSLRDGAPAKK